MPPLHLSLEAKVTSIIANMLMEVFPYAKMGKIYRAGFLLHHSPLNGDSFEIEHLKCEVFLVHVERSHVWFY